MARATRSVFGLAVGLCHFGLLLPLPLVHAQSGSGIIGFGISLWPDLCCEACYDSLSALYLNCTTFDATGMDSMDGMDMSTATTSDDCRASNVPWLQTMAYCIQSNCDAHGYTSASKQAQCFSLHAVAGASEPSYADSLPATAPTEELAEDALWLNTTSLVNGDLYYSVYGSEGNFVDSEKYHTKYAMAIYLTTIGVIVVCGLFRQLRSALPGLDKQVQTSRLGRKLQQALLLPALVGTRRYESLPGGVGSVPGRALGLFVAGYVVLNIILSCVSFTAFTPNAFWNSKQFVLCEYVGNRTGTLSLVNMSLAILFAGRNNLLLFLTGWSQSTFLVLHRWAARVAAVQAVVHSIVYTLAYFEPGYDGASAYAAEAAMSFYWWGIIATIAMSLATAMAVLPVRARLYEVFLVLHIVLAILALLGCWYHIVPHFGVVYGYQNWLYICFAYWAFNRLVRVGRVLYFNRIGLGSGVSTPATVELVPDTDIVHLTVFPRTWSFGPGQHTFLYFPTLGWGKGWESHPFSVAAWRTGEGVSAGPAGPDHPEPSDEEPKEVQVLLSAGNPHSPSRSIEFLVRGQSGMTAWLRDYAASAAPGKALHLPVYSEGPYSGCRTALLPLRRAETVLCVVGGVGITHALGLVQQYTDAARRRSAAAEEDHTGRSSSSTVMPLATRFILAWSVREAALLEHVQQRFLAQAVGVECQFWSTGKSASPKPAHDDNDNITLGRMNVGAVIRSSLEPGHPAAVIVCGPGSMADEASRQVIQCAREGFLVDCLTEVFGW